VILSPERLVSSVKQLFASGKFGSELVTVFEFLRPTSLILADTNSAEDGAAGLAAASRCVMNCQSESKYSIHLVVGGPGRSRYRCRWRGTASVADNAIPVGRRFRVRPILRAAEKLVARTPNFWALDQQLAPRRQH
jgi:hypothetical protein